MEKVIEKSLIIRKETHFEKLRKSIYMIFLKEEYELERKFEEFINHRKVDVSKIVIPREIHYISNSTKRIIE